MQTSDCGDVVRILPTTIRHKEQNSPRVPTAKFLHGHTANRFRTCVRGTNHIDPLSWFSLVLGVSLLLSAGVFLTAQPADRPCLESGSSAGAGSVLGTATYPIDLPTALRLANANNPTLHVVQARMREAVANLDRARLLWIPQLSFGPTFFYHDGIDQNRRGNVFIVSRGFYTFGAGPGMRVDLSEALYQPLVARQNARAAQARAEATANQIQLDVALAYWNLVELQGLKVINADILARVEQILAAAQTRAPAAGGKTTMDLARLRSEMNLRRQEGIVLRGRQVAASARLAQLLGLDPAVELVPYEPIVVPLIIVPGHLTVEQLLQIAFRARPELAAAAAQLGAAGSLVRQSKVAAFLPRLQGEFIAGGMGAGINGQFGPFTSQYNASLALIWNWEAFGAGNVAAIRARQANFDAVASQLRALQAQVVAEVVEAAQTARTHYEAIDIAQDEVRHAEELYRQCHTNLVDPLAPLDTRELFLAVQALNTARVRYLQQVLEFNRCQFRLHSAMGQPALTGWEAAERRTLGLPAVPTRDQTLPQPRPHNP